MSQSTSQKLSLKKVLSITLISLVFLLAGNFLVLQRMSESDIKYLTIRGDTDAYVSMIQGNDADVQSPFKFRVLVPFLAGALPLSPFAALKLVTYISLFLSYVFILLTCSKMGLGILHSLVGLLGVWVSTTHLYHYHNPYLTDAFGLLAISVMLFALVDDRFMLFLSATLLGILARETVIFLVPAWFFRREWRRAILVVTLSLIVLFIPRFLLGGGTDRTLFSVLGATGVFQQPLPYMKSLFYSWGSVWFLSFIGIWLFSGEKFGFVAGSFTCLLGGALFTSLIATDTGRMFSILTPVLAVTLAQLFSEMAVSKRSSVLVFVGLMIAHAFLAIPNIIFGVDSPVFGIPRLALLGVELVFVAYVWTTLQIKVKQKALDMKKILWIKRFLGRDYVYRHLR